MRIGFISDIHVDLNAEGGEDCVTGLLAAESRRRGLDILLVAGDLSGDFQLSMKTIDRLLAESGAQVFFAPRYNQAATPAIIMNNNTDTMLIRAIFKLFFISFFFLFNGCSDLRCRLRLLKHVRKALTCHPF